MQGQKAICAAFLIFIFSCGKDDSKSSSDNATVTTTPSREEQKKQVEEDEKYGWDPFIKQSFFDGCAQAPSQRGFNQQQMNIACGCILEYLIKNYHADYYGDHWVTVNEEIKKNGELQKCVSLAEKS